MKTKYAVDVPNPFLGEWVLVDYFDTKEEAISFCIEKFGADKNGNVNLISEMLGNEEDEDTE